MNSPLLTPLILIADDQRSEIEARLKSVLTLLGKNNAEEFSRIMASADTVFEVGPVLVCWSQVPDANHYLKLAENHRTVLLLDIHWEGQANASSYGIERLAKPLLRNPGFQSRCILLLKTKTSAGSAESWRRSFVAPLRTLRSGHDAGAGRVRYLGADSAEFETGEAETADYERDVVAKALLDLQEEVIFDGLNRGEWSVSAVDDAIAQFRAARFYGAFGGVEELGELYVKRVLDRYHHRFLPACWGTPLNLGIARLMESEDPNSLRALAKMLSGARGHEVVGLLSALTDYGEVAAIESFLFQLAPAAGRAIEKTNLGAAQSKWNPSKLAAKNVAFRRLNREKVDAALAELQTVLKRNGREDKLTNDRFTDLIDVFNPVDTSVAGQSIMRMHVALAEARAFILTGLPSAAVELLEIAFTDIEEELTEQALCRSEDNEVEHRPGLVTFEADFEDDRDRSRLDYAGKRTRLINRGLLHHPATEAARLVAQPDKPAEERLVEALGVYVQSPEATAALAKLRHEDHGAFDRCVHRLVETSANVGLPTSFKTFDKLWVNHWTARGVETKPAVLAKLFDREFMAGEFGAAIAEHNATKTGQRTPIELLTVPLLDLLLTHLAVLEYRIRSFCTLIGNDVVSEKTVEEKTLRVLKKALREAKDPGSTRKSYAQAEGGHEFKLKSEKLCRNLRELWTARHWHLLFSKTDVLSGANAFDPCVPWADDGGLVAALRQMPGGERRWLDCRRVLENYEIEVESGELRYRNPIPAWLRYGNLALPTEIIANLPDRPQRTSGTASYERMANRLGRRDSADTGSVE